jgi:cytochrome c peroxidase
MTIRLTASAVFASLAVAAFAADAAGQASLEERKRAFARDMEIDYPENNLPDAGRIALGKALFFDPRLSRGNVQSCASCHNPAFSWGDGLAVGRGDGMEMLERRSPTILNIAWAAVLMWDGRADTLEHQALGPIIAEVEMNMPEAELIERLEAIEGYAPLFAAAFGDAAVTPDRVARAIAAFERTVVSGIAPFDRWVDGEDDAISEAAKRGFDVFTGKGKCADCHDTWRFTDDGFYDLGLDTEDLGRAAEVPLASMQHAFKTPTLRNVELRGPYMHAGQIPTLREVVVHYEHGGIARASRSDKVGGLGLTEQDVDDLVAFMRTLTSNDAPVTVPLLPR